MEKQSMQNFKVIVGGAEEKVSYKPSFSHYRNARTKAAETLVQQYKEKPFCEIAKIFSESLRKFLYAAVKSFGAMKCRELDTNDELVSVTFQYMSLLFALFGAMTPRQIMQLFPIEKSYDGKRWQSKDYYSTMEEIKKVGIDTVIGEDQAPEFLMDYENWDINKFMVTFMLTVSRMRVLQGGRDIMEEFLEEQGVPIYSYYKDEGIMINPQTGEVVKVEKPRTKIPKHMKVIEGWKVNESTYENWKSGNYSKGV